MTWRNSMDAHRERQAQRMAPKPAKRAAQPQPSRVDHCVAALAAGGFPVLPTRTGAA